MISMKQPGVYGIETAERNRWYVGKSTNIRERLLQHKTGLCSGSHRLVQLQKHADAGEKTLAHVLHIRDGSGKGIASSERAWINRMDALANGYNRSGASSSGRSTKHLYQRASLCTFNILSGTPPQHLEASTVIANLLLRVAHTPCGVSDWIQASALLEVEPTKLALAANAPRLVDVCSPLNDNHLTLRCSKTLSERLRESEKQKISRLANKIKRTPDDVDGIVRRST